MIFWSILPRFCFAVVCTLSSIIAFTTLNFMEHMNPRKILLLLCFMALAVSVRATTFFSNQVYSPVDGSKDLHITESGTLLVATDEGVLDISSDELNWYAGSPFLESEGQVQDGVFVEETETGNRRAIYTVTNDGELSTYLVDLDQSGNLVAEYTNDSFILNNDWEVQKLASNRYIGLTSFDYDLVIFDSQLNVISLTDLPELEGNYGKNGIHVNEDGSITVIGHGGEWYLDPAGYWDIYRYELSSSGGLDSYEIIANYGQYTVPRLINDEKVWLLGEYAGAPFQEALSVYSSDASGNFAGVSFVYPELATELAPEAESAALAIRVVDTHQMSNGKFFALVAVSKLWFQEGSDVGTSAMTQVLVEFNQEGFAVFQEDLGNTHDFVGVDMEEDSNGNLLILGNVGGVEPGENLSPEISILTFGDIEAEYETEIFICAGDSAVLAAPPIPEEYSACPMIQTVIAVEPGNLSFAPGEDQISVSPTETTTYTIHTVFYPEPPGPGGLPEGCAAPSFSIDVTVEVQECNVTAYTCPGVPVNVPMPPSVDAISSEGTACAYDENSVTVTVTPDVGVVLADFNEGYIFAPTETTTYTIALSWPATDICPANGSFGEHTIVVETGDDCPTDPTDPTDPTEEISALTLLAEAYPWIFSLGLTDCLEVAEIWEYVSQTGYNYIYVIAQDGSGSNNVLYNESGQLYCTESGNYDCLAAYGLTQGVRVWSCDEIPPCICAGTYDPVCGSDGNTYINSCLAECEGIINYTAGACDDDYNPLLEDYPWVSSVLGPLNCNTYDSVTEYSSNGYQYLYFDATQGNSVLYNASGQLYCTETGNYDCIAAYGFTNGNVIWLCDDVVCDCFGDEGSIVCANGVEYLSACEAECFGVTDYVTGPCEQEPTPTFPDFPWLDGIVESSDCCEVSGITVYTSGAYQYVYVQSLAACGNSTLYNAQGQLYCQSSAGYNCLSLYGLSNGTPIYGCSDPVEPGCTFDTQAEVSIGGCGVAPSIVLLLADGTTLLPNTTEVDFNFVVGDAVSFSYVAIGEPELCGGSVTPIEIVCIQSVAIDDEPWENQYPWLSDMLDANNCCSSASVDEYSNGNVSYIIVTPETACGYPTMYNQSGQLYCNSGPGYDCISLYGLSSWTKTTLWNCSGKSQEIEPVIEETAVLFDLTVYPNPSNGTFNVNVKGEVESSTIQVLDLSGRAIYRAPAFEQNNVDLVDVVPGMYLLQVIHQKEVLTEKILIN